MSTLKLLGIVGALLVIIAIVAFMFPQEIVGNPHVQQDAQLPDYEPYRASLSGEIACVPRKDGTPEPLCYTSLLADGKYYLIDYNLMSQTPPEFAVGDKVTGNGLVTPIQRLSTDQWQKFEVTGIFSITDSLSVTKSEE